MGHTIRDILALYWGLRNGECVFLMCSDFIWNLILRGKHVWQTPGREILAINRPSSLRALLRSQNTNLEINENVL